MQPTFHMSASEVLPPHLSGMCRHASVLISLSFIWAHAYGPALFPFQHHPNVVSHQEFFLSELFFSPGCGLVSVKCPSVPYGVLHDDVDHITEYSFVWN